MDKQVYILLTTCFIVWEKESCNDFQSFQGCSNYHKLKYDVNTK